MSQSLDSSWNKIIRRKFKSKKASWRKYYLVLKKLEYPRLIGELLDTGEFTIKRHPYKHLHHETDSFGFNCNLIYNLLEKNQPILFTVRIIWITYLIRPQWIVDNAVTHKKFGEGVLETQVFVPKDKIMEMQLPEDWDYKKFIDNYWKEEEVEVEVEKEVDRKELAKQV